MEKKKNDFIAQGSILAIASILVRVMGMIYRIPMTAIIGDKGNGFYSYAYSVYTILLLLSSYSLPLAVSKMVSAKAQLAQCKESIYMCNCICNRYWYYIWFDCINWCAVFYKGIFPQ